MLCRHWYWGVPKWLLSLSFQEINTDLWLKPIALESHGSQTLPTILHVLSAGRWWEKWIIIHKGHDFWNNHSTAKLDDADPVVSKSLPEPFLLCRSILFYPGFSLTLVQFGACGDRASLSFHGKVRVDVSAWGTCFGAGGIEIKIKENK